MEWNFRDISSNYCPRQFEYHPSKNGKTITLDSFVIALIISLSSFITQD